MAFYFSSARFISLFSLICVIFQIGVIKSLSECHCSENAVIFSSIIMCLCIIKL